VLAIAASSAACGGSTSANPAASPTRPAAAPAPTPDPTPAPETGPITIAFAGDIHFEGRLRSRLDDPGTALEPIAPYLSDADLTIVNLETSIGTSGIPESKRYTFQAPPEALQALAAAGVDVATMANNHGVDYGTEGLADTLDAAAKMAGAEPPLSVIGIGSDAEQAFAPALRTVRGTTVAVLAASTADDPTADPTAHWAARDDRGGIALARNPARLVQAVGTARAEADVVAVYLHWGIQGQSCPSRAQTDLARTLADAGADIVVGSHAHVLQGAGVLGDTYVAYGLGNFVWYRPSSTGSSTTGVLTLTVEERRVVDAAWAPARVQPNGLPRFSKGTEAQQMIAAFSRLRDCTNLGPR